MFTRRNLFIALPLLCLISTAQAAVTYQVDENGNGTFRVNNGNPIPLLFGMRLEPNSGITTLAYTLGAPTTNGDLILTEPGGGNSDVIRFFNDFLYFFSELPEAGETPDMADVGLPTTFLANRQTIPEVGNEGMNGATYGPTTGQPGFAASIAPVTYVILSDTPEPATMTVSTGALIILGLRRRSRHA